MAWLNTPVGIVENDAAIRERMTITSFYDMNYVPKIYGRTISWVTTRYVGCDKTGATAFRDALLVKYPPNQGVTAPTIEASLHPAGGGQYHVVATLKTYSNWALEA